ncbi:MAG: protein kinase [Candidatus Melainabacteria bacterium]|nr:protein kinase [Candidatus Melainabacteria bacterium]
MTTGELQKQARLQRRGINKPKVKEAAERIRFVTDGEPHEEAVDDDLSQKIATARSDDDASLTSPATKSPTLPDLGDRYEVLDTLGQGGMGAVYKVFDKLAEKIVAIKILHANLIEDQTALRRFEQEAEAASQLEHNNLVAVFSYGKTENGAPYLVMAYIEGESLSSVVNTEGALQPERALNLFHQICDALVHAHEKGVIHRDVKPANVIVTKSNAEVETARVVDFGIAKILPVSNRETHNLTETRQVFGSPHYMSPEHCLGFKMDERSDIYSLGCLMYEVLTGNPPFPESDAIQVVIKHINDEAKPFPREFGSEPIQKKLEGVVLKCLEKDQADRYQSVGELMKDLELIQEGKAPSKFVRRKVPKLEYSATQIVRAVIGTFLILMFIGNAVGWLNLVGNHFCAAAIFLVCLTGGSLFGMAAVEQNRRLAAGKNSNGDWWNMLLLLSLIAMCLSYVPTAFEIALSSFQLPLLAENPGLIRDLISGFTLAHLLSIGSSLVCLVGGTLFGSAKKTRFYRVAVQYACVMYVLILGTVSVFPTQVSSFTTNVSDAHLLENHFPEARENLLNVALKLDPLNQRALFSLVDVNMDKWNSDKANQLFTDYFALETAPKKLAAAHFKLSSLDKNESWMKLDQLTKAIQLFPRYDYYEHRARLHMERGEFNDALKDFEEAIRSEPSSPEPYIGRAQIFASTKNYELAILELNRIAEQRSGWSNIDVFFLRALLFDQMGRERMAMHDFMTAGEIAKTDPYISDADAFKAAYSFGRLGDPVNGQRFADHKEVDKPAAYYRDLYKRMGLTLK